MVDRTFSLGSVDLPEGTAFRPSGDYIVIKPTERENHRFGDGVVLSIGPGIPDENGNVFEVEYKEGDRILHDKHAGFHEMGAFILTRRQHVVAILDDDAEIK